MTDGFLGRWSRRKQEVREGKPPVEPVPATALPNPAGPAPARAPEPAEIAVVALPGTVDTTPEAAPAQSAQVPLPTLDDVPALTPASDFKPFMAQGVAQDVRNAAVKKLFVDPHFNRMDRLDTYIDDYGLPDPIPATMLRQMASAKVLKLFDDGLDGSAKTPRAGDDADTAPRPDVAQSVLVPESPALPANAAGPPAAPTSTEDAHTDLRLQPDHAPQRESAGPGP